MWYQSTSSSGLTEDKHNTLAINRLVEWIKKSCYELLVVREKLRLTYAKNCAKIPTDSIYDSWLLKMGKDYARYASETHQHFFALLEYEKTDTWFQILRQVQKWTKFDAADLLSCLLIGTDWSLYEIGMMPPIGAYSWIIEEGIEKITHVLKRFTSEPRWAFAAVETAVNDG